MVDSSIDPVLQQAAFQALQSELPALRRRTGTSVEGAIVALDPYTGEVRSLVGGDRYPDINAALLAERTGSAVKIYYGAPALDYGFLNGAPLTPLSQLDTDDCSVNGWQPDPGQRVGMLGARQALASSNDCGAVVVAKSIGLERACAAIALALQNKPKCSGPALVGGASGSEVTPLHMAEGLAAFVNGGKRVEARFMADHSPPAGQTQLFSPAAAFMELQMMRSVMGDPRVPGGATGAQARVWSGLPVSAQVAGKTGTDTANRFWIEVAQPHLVVVVMVAIGTDKKLSERDGFQGGMIAGQVWATFVRKSFSSAPYYFTGQFQQPSGVEWQEVNRPFGCLQSGTSDYEVFMPARTPTPCVWPVQ
jgi:penicillin-binding protein 1A